MSTLKTIWQEIKTGQNLDLYLTMFLTFIVAIFGILGIPSFEILLSAILASLSLLCFSLLQNRHLNDAVKAELERLRQKRGLSSQFLREELYDASALRERIRNAHRADFLGVTLSRTISTLDSSIQEGLKLGLTVRIILPKPNSSAVEMLAFQRPNVMSAASLNSALLATLRRLAEIASMSEMPEKMEVRVIDCVPAWGIIAIDPQLSEGYISVRLNTFKVVPENSPRFELLASDDGKWFTFFASQFDQLWNNAEHFKLAAIEK